jgi:hypothetical protein
MSNFHGRMVYRHSRHDIEHPDRVERNRLKFLLECLTAVTAGSKSPLSHYGRALGEFWRRLYRLKLAISVTIACLGAKFLATIPAGIAII